MALNPVAFTEKVLQSFLRYQLRAFPLADPGLNRQMRELLSLDEARESPLLRGPWVSISRPFRGGATPDALAGEGLLHPHLAERIRADIRQLYRHQEKAIRAISDERHTLVSTGTGSGKTECFLYPVVSQCLKLRDERASAGISAVIVYPMNALAEDQLMRLRSLLAGTGVPFGMYVGKTPESESQVGGIRLPTGASQADYKARLAQARTTQSAETVHPAEEVCSREAMRTPGKQPRILLTNVKQLELLLTRQRDVELFEGARLEHLVFDEAHTFTGAMGAETACLVRRLRAFCGRDAADTVCVATSATIVDRERPDAARAFASRFFGVPEANVVTVSEDYEEDAWTADRKLPAPMHGDAMAVLSGAVRAVEDDPEGPNEAVRQVYRQLSAEDLSTAPWPEALHDALSGNALLHELSSILQQPRPLDELPEELEKATGRQTTEAEILAWLTLAAAARRRGRPLLRPVMHAFVRGIPGAVATFPGDTAEPRLWLAAEDEIEAAAEDTSDESDEDTAPSARLPVLTCTTCGQHYFETHLQDFEFSKGRPGRGEPGPGGTFWMPLDAALGGNRAILVDRLIGDEEGAATDGAPGSPDASGKNATVLARRTSPLHLCRRCGAAHERASARCQACGMPGDLVRLHAVRQKRDVERVPGAVETFKDRQGVLTSCLSCGAIGGRAAGGHYREPARPVRASNAADVHVLAQDMVQHSERPRLLVFCDNRQDAAFQAGWMKDHARRFRLRALMADGLASGRAGSIGDLTWFLESALERDEALSRALIPEVWRVARQERAGQRHMNERRKFLRMQVLQEVAESPRQTLGLEPWGRMKVDYVGLKATLPWVQRHANQLGLPPEAMREGIATALDYMRRRKLLFDAECLTFTKNRLAGDLEIQQGYLKRSGGVQGVKLKRGPGDASERVLQWLRDGGPTTMKQMAAKWGAAPGQVDELLTSLFGMLVERRLLRPVQLQGARGGVLPYAAGVHQVDADRLALSPHHGVYRCRTCRTRTVRRTPHDRCPAFRCDGVLEWLREDPDDYDLQLLDGDYSMLRPEEHTAMVPHQERERLENLFKGRSQAVNCFVCTATLELGVDIGALDAVLMRNVPPLPANYWQRAGRAGRRHRMAVNLTYCRPVSHDRAYFAAPEKLLSGRVDPPAFNLSNDVMVRKHVNASVLTGLRGLARDFEQQDAGAESEAIGAALANCMPRQVTPWLFHEDGAVRSSPFDFGPVAQVVRRHRKTLLTQVQAAFAQGWPAADSAAVTSEVIEKYIDGFADGLAEAARALRKRLVWALEQTRRLHAIQGRDGTLSQEDDALRRRCDRLIKSLKGEVDRRRRDPQGHLEANVFNVLSVQGFLPGYGLETGSVQAMAEVPFWHSGPLVFSLPRPTGMALREYVPGNLIYANGHRFVARRFLRSTGEEAEDLPFFEVSSERQAVRQCAPDAPASLLGSQAIGTLAVCDVDLAHRSQISDDEEYRFQMGVAVYGLERRAHRGGRAMQWGDQDVHLRHGVHLRLVNVGASSEIKSGSALGYPVCTVCGQSVSPLSSEEQQRDFAKKHLERCGQPVDRVGFHADLVADVLSLPGLPSPTEAFSVMEALRIGAAEVLDMHVEDLQILVIGHIDREQRDALLWDPMPGGSGLLDQLVERFSEVVQAAQAVVSGCASACGHSCIDCLQTFRNSYFHEHLDRHEASDCLRAWGDALEFSHSIPAAPPPASEPAGQPVNEAERKLQRLLGAAGFPDGSREVQLTLGSGLGTTTPDVLYRGDEGAPDVCIYLDGLSKHLHGDPATAARDREIRYWLRQREYEVLEIAFTDLDDAGAMTRHFRRLALYLGADEPRARIQDEGWFEAAGATLGPDGAGTLVEASETRVPRSQPAGDVLRFVKPTAQTRYRSCVPLLEELEAAAGSFGPAHGLLDEASDHPSRWVEVGPGRRLAEGMFAARVAGQSMAPRIPDGAVCLFRSSVSGSRNGRIVLVRLRDDIDPETGERFTVKRYRSEKRDAADGPWRHVRVTLEPLNPAFRAIELNAEDEAGSGAIDVIAEFVEVLHVPPTREQPVL